MRDRQDAALRIGALASATELTPDTVRYYERLGLLPKAARTSGRFRIYPRETVQRVHFIKQAKRLGLELREIRELLAPANGQRREQCGRVRALLARHLQDVEARLRDLEAFQRTLTRALGDCDRALRHGENIPCPVVANLQRHQP